MKHFITICSIIIILLSCEDEKIISPNQIEIDYKFSKIEIWLSNIIVKRDIYINYSYSKSDTLFKSVYEEFVCINDKTIKPPYIYFYYRISGPYNPNFGYKAFKCKYNPIDHSLDSISFKFNKRITKYDQMYNGIEWYSHEIILATSDIKINDSTRIEAVSEYNELLKNLAHYYYEWESSWNYNHDYGQTNYKHTLISLTDSSSVRIVLTPE